MLLIVTSGRVSVLVASSRMPGSGGACIGAAAYACTRVPGSVARVLGTAARVLFVPRVSVSPRAASSDGGEDHVPLSGPIASRMPTTMTAVKTGVESRFQARDTVEL